ncbi:MAG: type IV secretory system conjugative DNA transfer family protein [candidate division Zixibacteria bacterium]|nr:type IV secretory system conjugative DNA transfer family protein [candidate division Zixibacteria bacterium]
MEKVEKKLEEVRQLLNKNKRDKPPRLLLGHRYDEPFVLEGKDLENSFHIMGATREGKSKQIENIFRQFIEQGIGGAVIDPHGYLYDDLLAYCSYKSSRMPEILDRIVLFDPGDDNSVVGFNTLQQIAGHDIDTLTLSRMYATIKARGKDNFDEMPTAKTWLQNIFYPLIQKGLTLIEAKHLIDRGAPDSELAMAIVNESGIDLIEHDWSWYEKQTKQTQYAELLSSVNMLRSFVSSKRMELMLGRKEGVLDLRKIMDEGKILLVNLSSRKIHQDIARLLGTLLVNEFFLVAKMRPKDSRPFYLAIDEFENYVTQDIADVLDQGPKFGIHLILAHHSLEQLKEQNQKVYAAVMQNAKIKIIYGGLTYENSEILIKELFSYRGRGGLNPDQIKRIQKSPYIEPTESTRTVSSDSYGESESSAHGSHSGHVMQTGDTTIPVDDLFMSDQLSSHMSSSSSMSSSGDMKGSSSNFNHTDSVVPFIIQELKWYISSIQYYSLDEQVYRAIARMKNLPQQICMVKLPKQPVKTIKTNYVKEYHELEGELEQFTEQVNQSSPYHITPQEAVAEREKITQEILGQLESEQPDDEDDRWQ